MCKGIESEAWKVYSSNRCNIDFDSFLQRFKDLRSLPMAECAERWGVSHQAVSSFAKYYGLETRTKRGRSDEELLVEYEEKYKGKSRGHLPPNFADLLRKRGLIDRIPLVYDLESDRALYNLEFKGLSRGQVQTSNKKGKNLYERMRRRGDLDYIALRRNQKE